LAPRTGEARHLTVWQRALLAALLVAAPGIPAPTAAQALATPRPRAAAAVAMTRFSDLTELTPANVHGLMPLLSRTVTVAQQDQDRALRESGPAWGLQVDSSAGVDPRLQRFVEDRTGQVQPAATNGAPQRPIGGRVGCVVSYLIGSPAAGDGGPASVAPAPRALRAWDPIERRVLWSVTESLPISYRTLITAGGLVFYATADGWLKALDARTGRLLWKHKVDDGKLEEPLSFRGIDGHQYIAVRSVPNAPGEGSTTLFLFALAH
jgi:hypothetical protein